MTWYSTFGVVASSSRSYSRSRRSRTMSMCSRPEEAAAEAEPERLRGLGLPAQRGVVQRQLLQRVAQVGVVVGVHREEAAEDHRLDLAVARAARLGRGLGHAREGVPHPQVAQALEPGHEVAGLPGPEVPGGRSSTGAITPTCSASTTSPVCMASSLSPFGERRRPSRGRRRPRPGTGRTPSRRSGRGPARRGPPRAGGTRATIASSTSGTPSPVLAEMRSTRSGSSPISSATARPCSSGSAAGRSILLSTGISSRFALDGQVGVGQRLGLDALAGVHHQQRALAGGQAARDLVAEVHVPRGVDQVELVGQPVRRRVVHAHGLRLDRDPPLALEVHRVEHLAAHVAVAQRPGGLEDAVRQR